MVLKTFIFLLIFVNQIYPQYPDKRIHSLLDSGIENILRQDYKAARKSFSLIDKEYPQLPAGKIYLAAVDIIESYDLGIEYPSEYIESNLDRAAELAEKRLEKYPDSLWDKYFAGLAEGYYAYYEAINENWISAFGRGVSSVNFFRECLIDSNEFIEAFAAVGSFLYWRSSKLQFLTWFSIVEDEKEKGIKYLEKASSQKNYNRFLAINSLIWVFIDKNDFQKAAITAEKILAEYPENRIFKWSYARALENIDKSRAIEVYSEILDSYAEPSEINEITLKHKIAQLYYQLGDHPSALKLCRGILSKNISDYAQEVLKSRLERVKKLYTELSK